MEGHANQTKRPENEEEMILPQRVGALLLTEESSYGWHTKTTAITMLKEETQACTQGNKVI